MALAEESLVLKEGARIKSCSWNSGKRGLGFLLTNDGEYSFVSPQHAAQTVHAGDLLVFNTGVPGKLTALNDGPDDGPARARFFSVDHEQLLCLLNVHERCIYSRTDNLSQPRLYRQQTSLARQCHALLDALPPGRSLEQRCQLLNIAGTALTQILEQAQAGLAHPCRGQDEIAPLLDRLTLQQIETMPIANLAKQLGYSRRHLSRLFRDHLGVSLASLKMELRLEKATILLQDTAAKVINIAEECGFNHLGLFSACFKKRFGVSPSEWRRQALAAQARVSRPATNGTRCEMKSRGLCIWNQPR